MAELVRYAGVVEAGVAIQQLASALVHDDEPLIGLDLRAGGSSRILWKLLPEDIQPNALGDEIRLYR